MSASINIEKLLKELDPATLQEEKLFPATRRLCIYMIEYLRKKGLYRELQETLNEKNEEQLYVLCEHLVFT